MNLIRFICVECDDYIKGKVHTVGFGNVSFHYCEKHWEEKLRPIEKPKKRAAAKLKKGEKV